MTSPPVRAHRRWRGSAGSVAGRAPRGLLIPSCLLALVPSTARAQGALREGRAQDVGVDPRGLAHAVAVLEEAVREGELAGVVWLVARDGVIVAHGAVGQATDERPMRTDTLFRMASNTKPVVAAGVLALVAEGALQLDDPIARFLPAFGGLRGREITVRQLLSHTSGLRIAPIFLTPLLERSERDPDAPSLQAEVARFGAIGAAVSPGTSYAYSNPGYNTLGALLEVLSGQPLEAFLAARFYAPLGMRDTCHHESVADPNRMACVRRKGSDGTWRITWRPGDPPDYPFVRASGGMITTARDYAAFLQLFLDGGRVGDRRLLPEALVREATRSQTDAVRGADAERSGYGLGWSVAPDGSFSHEGSDGTGAWVDPGRALLGVVLTQSTGGANPRTTFRRRVEEACERR